MKKYLYLITVFLISLPVSGQETEDRRSVSFDSLISAFRHYAGWDPFLAQKNDSVTSSSLFRTDEYNVSVSRNPINFETDHVILNNPYFTDDYEDYEDRIINYPASYSVIYDQRLISLFGNGKFVCHDPDTYLRDESFESQLNTKKFRQHWVIDGDLYAQSKSRFFGKLYKWNGDKWVRAKIKLPVKDQPVLFSDEEFIVFRDCNGEWGGTIYFYDRAGKNIYFTLSTCANTVTKRNDRYLVLAHLGHMAGISEIKSIENPRELPVAKKREIGEIKNWETSGYTETSPAFKIPLELFGVQLFSTFRYGDRRLFVSNLNELTFLAEINEKEIAIVHPLFGYGIYTHDPVTRTYGDYQLINLDHYGTAFDREISLIIIKGNRISLLDWNENHSR